jgi:hypothetical protein
MQYFYLEVTRGVERGKRYPLSDGAISIGRSSSNTISLHSSEKNASGHHAIIYKSSDKILIQDMQSTNGTYVNEERIQERDLNPDDIIGFGQKGPRLKYIVSEKELSTTSVSDGIPEVDTGARTIDGEDRTVSKKPPTSSTENSTKTALGRALKKRPPKDDPFAMQAASVTMEMENKLKKGSMEADDMHSLMKNKKRVEKILDRGKLSDGQSSLLASAYGAGKKTRKQWVIIVSSVAFVSLVVIVYLTIRMLQYKQMLNKGLSLEDQLDVYEQEIFKANLDPEANKKLLAGLIKELEETKTQLSSVKENLNEEDVGKFYTDETERCIAEIMTRFGEKDYHIPPTMVERVKHHIDVYSKRLHKTIGRYLKRKDKYFPMIREILVDKKLPIELAYISMLESGFNPNALSHAGARGLWQFMPATGRRYGLAVNNRLDERCDPEKATYAAAEYFKDLIAEFGGRSSIMLAMAAYNAGEGRVRGALRKIEDPMHDRDFWYIYRMGWLAEETNEYIPRMLALMIIDEHPVKYGFETSGVEPEVEEQEDDFIELDF